MESRVLNRKGRSVRAVSPAISTVIITGTIVVLVSVAIAFANNYLWMRVAEGDFNSAKQFMQTMGLEIDDVAWIMGRTETVRYSSRYGEVSFQPSTLNYTIYVDTGGGYYRFVNYTVGVLLFNIPVSRYSLFNGYYELIFPSSASTLILKGTSAPVVRVFAVEKLPMSDGSYIRIVVAPSVRSLFSNVTREGDSTFYVKLYLPVLEQGSSPRKAQSATLTGISVTAKTIGNVTGVKVKVGFPSDTLGFDNSFFQFPVTEEEITIPSGYSNSVLEVYAGEVTVEFGVHV
jgi:hypothetical protein